MTRAFHAESVAYLEQLQSDLEPPGRMTQEESDDRAEEVLRGQLDAQFLDPEALNALIEAGRRIAIPTRFESRFEYAAIMSIVDDIHAALSEDHPLDPLRVVGTLPIGWPLAMLLRVPRTDKHLVVVDSSFTTLANLLAKHARRLRTALHQLDVEIRTLHEEALAAWDLLNRCDVTLREDVSSGRCTLLLPLPLPHRTRRARCR